MSDIGTFGERLLAAFGWAGKHGRKARLHNRVRDELKRGQSESVVLERMIEATDDDPALMVEMLDELQFRRALLDNFIRRYAEDLRHQGETVTMFPRKRATNLRAERPIKQPNIETSPQGDGAGHLGGGTQASLARPTNGETGANGADRGGQSTPDSHGGSAAPDENAPHDGAGGGQSGSDTQANVAPATDQDSGGQSGVDTHVGRAAASGDGDQPCADTRITGVATPDKQDAPSGAADGAGHNDGDTLIGGARSTAPSHSRRAAALANRQKSAPTRRQPGRSARTGTAAMQGASATMKRCVLDLITINGQRLREATAEEALTAAEKRKVEAAQIRAICRDLRPDDRVGDKLDDQEAQHRAEEAQRELAPA